MFIQNQDDGSEVLVTSASDLTAASMCEFAFLRRLDLKLGREVSVPDNSDAMLERAARLGDAHEDRMLEWYRRKLGIGVLGQPGGVVEIAKPDSRSAVDVQRAAEETTQALHSGADIVFQATFSSEVNLPDPGPSDMPMRFIGFADFIARTNTGPGADNHNAGGDSFEYEVQDTKLARRAKVTALLQLAAYAEQLELLGVEVAPSAVLILGDGARSRHRLADIAPVFRSRRARLHELLVSRLRERGPDGERHSAQPIAWGDPSIMACGSCEVCEPEVLRTRDPLLIAGIRKLQRDRLVAAGITTIDSVAALAAGAEQIDSSPQAAPLDAKIFGIAPAVLQRLALQAEVQIESEQAAGDVPRFRVANPAALAAIPTPNPGDLFFDFEGDPLYREPGDREPGDREDARWGLDYLFGMIDSEETFTAIWAHNLDEERQALEQFLKLVSHRRQRFPDMKIYHYAPYERTHLLSIAARHGVGEQAVDQLLSDHVLVDLYPIVKQSLRVGSRSYSIKKLEPLYMGERLRDEDGVTNAADSIVEYAEATALLASESESDRRADNARLEDIADYNKYDCVSTLYLRNWLLSLANKYEITPFDAVDARVEAAEARNEPVVELSTVGAALAMHASLAADERDRRAAALGGSAIDYHQREQKSFWWSHFGRLVDPIEDWADTRDVIVVDHTLSRVETDWHQPPRARVDRRELRLRGEVAAGSGLRAGSDVFLLYSHPAPFDEIGAQPGARGTRKVKVLERHADGVTVLETLPKNTEHYRVLPEAVAPGPPPPAGQQKTAIEDWGAMFAAALDAGHFPVDPVVDILRRNQPRLLGDAAIVPPDSDAALEEAEGIDGARHIGAVTATLRMLDHSALAVQGPPGTGKTYLAARVIKRLVEHYGWHIGVVAQSHKVVENVLEGVLAAGLNAQQIGKVPQGGALDPDKPAPGYTVLRTNGHDRFVSALRETGCGSVTGGTAWDFSNQSRFARKSLDLLVIDEAGQFSLAPTIAASLAAKRLLLLGDPQQLPQVSQGSHPEPVDTSALGWLLDEHETMPESLGYFLAETRRMHPALTEIVSELSYENRLVAHQSVAERHVAGAGAPGLVWHPVEHADNSTSSVEEAAVVVALVSDFLEGATMGVAPGESRDLTQNDIIVVAAYNAQVECVSEALGAAGLQNVRVGTVDRFQGQEAVVAIVTLAASSAADVPRGLEFLLMRNRLNVAISRAQWSAHLVSSSRLGDGLPSSAAGVTALSGYLRLTERGSPPSQARQRTSVTSGTSVTADQHTTDNPGNVESW